MNLTLVDWAIVASYFALTTVIGLYFTKRGGESLTEYFISGRAAPWWLAGASMVATTFAADTPLLVTGLVATKGVAGNWLWWNYVMSGMLTVFFFARLWRRANVMTDVEFSEVRYGGRPAAFLRGFRAIYLAIPINLVIIGWVTRAMIKILTISLGVSPWLAVGICFVVTALLLRGSGPVGRAVDGSRAIRHQDDRGHRPRRLCGPRGGWDSRDATPARPSLWHRRRRHCRSCRSTSAGPTASRRTPGCPSWRSACSCSCSGGRPGIQAPNPAAGATSRNASSPRGPSATACWRRSSFRSRTTRSGPGPGSSPGWPP